MTAHWSIEDVQDYETACYWRMTIREYADLFNMDADVVKAQLRAEWPKPSFYLIDKSIKPDDVTDDTLVGRMDPVCEWLIFQGLPRTGHMTLTLDNVGDVYKRLRLMGERHYDIRPQRVVDGSFEYGSITMGELLKFVGVYYNAVHSRTKTVTGFCKRYELTREDWRDWSPTTI